MTTKQMTIKVQRELPSSMPAMNIMIFRRKPREGS